MATSNNSYLTGLQSDMSLSVLQNRRRQVVAWYDTHMERGILVGEIGEAVLSTPNLDQQLIVLGERLSAVSVKIEILNTKAGLVIGGLKPNETAYRNHLLDIKSKIESRIDIVTGIRAEKRAVWAYKRGELQDAIDTLDAWMSGM